MFISQGIEHKCETKPTVGNVWIKVQVWAISKTKKKRLRHGVNGGCLE